VLAARARTWLATGVSIVAPETPSTPLQDLYAPNNRCFGCGPANEKGLRIKSQVLGDEVVADFTPEAHHQAFAGVLSGGIIGTLLDCHSNWTAAHHLMKLRGQDSPPCTVTSEFHVKMRRPTSMNSPVHLKAKVIESAGDRAVVEARLFSEGKETASCRGVFVAVKEGHPAYHRW
jgi:acyl-coenzyme A thioesterase PaaI-like protein